MELDLGDMLAALEKHQQAMKAKQLTNTKPLSFTGIKIDTVIKKHFKTTEEYAPWFWFDSFQTNLLSFN